MFSDAGPKRALVEAGRTFRVKPFAKSYKTRNDNELITDRLRPGLPTTASGVARQGTYGHYVTTGLKENKRRKVSEEAEELRKGRRTVIRVGTLNIETMTERGRELTDIMERRNVDVMYPKETKWKGSKARNIRGG